MIPELKMKIYRNVRNPDPHVDRWVEDYGVVGYRQVTLDFVREIVDHLSGVSGDSAILWGTYKYHGAGDGVTAESSNDTALENELDTRVAGTSTESDTEVYQSVGTWIPSTGPSTVTEHGLFDTDVTGRMMDRTVLGTSAVITTDDTIQFTYSLTVAWGG
jgi:hypothetical protein